MKASVEPTGKVPVRGVVDMAAGPLLVVIGPCARGAVKSREEIDAGPDNRVRYQDPFGVGG